VTASDALAGAKLMAIVAVVGLAAYVGHKGFGIGKGLLSGAGEAISKGVDAVAEAAEGAKNAALDTVSGSEGRDFYKRQYADKRIEEAAQILDANDARARRSKPVVGPRSEVSYWDGLLDGSSGGYVAP
jgi:hypothetical protein